MLHIYLNKIVPGKMSLLEYFDGNGYKPCITMLLSTNTSLANRSKLVLETFSLLEILCVTSWYDSQAQLIKPLKLASISHHDSLPHHVTNISKR
jgi:hypothetical protein